MIDRIYVQPYYIFGCYGRRKIATCEEFTYEIKEFRCGFVREIGNKI